MKKKIDNTEIDLAEIIITILKNKLKVTLILLMPSVVALTIWSVDSKETPKSIFTAETEIVPNSIFEDYKYQAFNSFVDGLMRKYPSMVNQEYFRLNDKENSITIIPDSIKNYNVFSNFDFEKIDRFFLYELFVEKISHKKFLIKAIKEFNLIEKKENENTENYEKEVLKLASSINIEKIKTDENKIKSIKILAKTNDKENWEKFLKFIEKSANKEIQNYLKKKFELLILNVDRLNNYIIEDIEFEISTNTDLKNNASLKKIRKRITENQDIKRLKNLYNETSIISSDKFSSGVIKVQSTDFKDITIYNPKKSLTNILALSLLLGLFLSVIYVMIVNSINKRR